MKKYLLFFLCILSILIIQCNNDGKKSGGSSSLDTAASVPSVSSLGIAEDAWVYAFKKDKNYGDGGGWKDITDPANPVTIPRMFLGFGGSDIKIILLKFDISGIIKDKPVKSAFISVYNDFAGSAAGVDIDAKFVSSTWDEKTVTYNSIPQTDPDVLSSAAFQGAIGFKQTGKWYRFDVTRAVKFWQEGKENNGIMLLPQGDSGVDFQIVCREALDMKTYFPKLEISY